MSDNQRQNLMYVIQTLMGLLILILSGLITWMLVTVNAQQTKIALMQQSLELVVSDTEKDKKQDATLTKFWRLHSWERAKINELRVVEGMPIEEWPDLTVED